MTRYAAKCDTCQAKMMVTNETTPCQCGGVFRIIGKRQSAVDRARRRIVSGYYDCPAVERVTAANVEAALEDSEDGHLDRTTGVSHVGIHRPDTRVAPPGRITHFDADPLD